MKKTFTGLALAALFTGLYAQIVTQNVTPNTVAAKGSVACIGNGKTYTADNNYSRVFDLADFGINYQFKITKIAFGVESVNKPLQVGVQVYQSIGTYPFGTTALLSNYEVDVVPADGGNMVSTSEGLSTVIPANGKFVVEVSHNGKAKLESFFMGTHVGGQTGPSFLSTETCKFATPTATGTGQLAAYQDAQWVMTITGENNLGVTEIINSKNLQVYPNPVKDVLNIKMGSGIKMESAELIDYTGRQIKTRSVTPGTIDVSYLPEGNYILKVQGSDGNTYIQKVLKN